MNNRHLNRSPITRIERLGEERRSVMAQAFDRRGPNRPDVKTVLAHLKRLNDEREALIRSE
jgi:hypothetical protein